MKKRYAVIMTAAMMTGVMAATTLAEGPGMDGGQQISGPQMPGLQMPGGNETGPPPQMDGQQPPQGEAPTDDENTQTPEMSSEVPQGEAPAENGDNQAPEMNGQASQMSENSQLPQMNGKGPEDGFGFIEFRNFVEDGTISQDTYDAITKYMEENKPDLPEGMEKGEHPELPEGAKNGEKPELPEGAKEGEHLEMKEGEGPDLLKDLLEAGVITQEEYDTLAAAREANKPAAPAANQNDESTQTTNESAGS